MFFLVVVAVYVPSMRNGFVYDDHEVILAQAAPHSLADLGRIFSEPHVKGWSYYRPVTRATLLYQKTLHGDVPAPFHLVNGVLMGVAGLLAYSLLRLPAFGVRPLVALFAAAAFAVHPVASSCVHPIASGRETVLPAVLILAALYAFLRGGAVWHGLAMVFLAAALFSKEQAVIAPALFLFADLLGLSTNPPGRDIRQWFGRYLLIALVMLLYLLIRWSLFGGTEYDLSEFAARGGPLWSFGYAMQSIVMPFWSLRYEPVLKVWVEYPRLIFSVVLILAITVAGVRHSWSSRRLVLFWLSWFLVTLLPTANLLHQEARFAERYGFLAMLAILGMAAGMFSVAWDSGRARPWLGIAGVVLAAWVLMCAGVSVHRAGYYRSDAVFFGCGPIPTHRWLTITLE